MKISLIYNYSEGEQDMAEAHFSLSFMKNKKIFAQWLLDFPKECNDEAEEDDELWDLDKLKKLSFVSCCIYMEGDKSDLPEWYNKGNGRIWYHEGLHVKDYEAASKLRGW